MIEQYDFGSMTIEGKRYNHDLKIIEQQVVSNWWRKEEHLIELSDVKDILSTRPAILVVGTGYSGNMKVPESFRSALAGDHIQLIEESTKEAIKTFNRLLTEGKRVAGAFHLTC